MPVTAARSGQSFQFTLCAVACFAVALGCSKAKVTRSAGADAGAAPAEGASEVSTPAPVSTVPGAPNGMPWGHVPLPESSIVPPPLTPPAEALAGPGGTHYQVLKMGTGSSVGPTDSIVLDYNMWTGDGKLALSTYTKDQATGYSVTNISPQFRTLLTSLKSGSRARYWIPRAALVGWKPDDWPDADLVIEIELLSVSRTKYKDAQGNAFEPEPAVQAPDTAGPPNAAIGTKSGLRYIFLSHGTATEHPSADARLNLTLDAYAVSGLTLDRLERGFKTATTLERAPGNLPEVLSQLVSGDRVRIWLPAKPAKEVIPKADGRDVVLDLSIRF